MTSEFACCHLGWASIQLIAITLLFTCAWEFLPDVQKETTEAISLWDCRKHVPQTTSHTAIIKEQRHQKLTITRKEQQTSIMNYLSVRCASS